MNWEYYNLLRLPEAIRDAHNIKSKQRLDLVGVKKSALDISLKPLINKKGQLFVYLGQRTPWIQSSGQNHAEWVLSNSSINLTSIYTDPDFPELGYGYPNPNIKLSNGEPNPMFAQRNDLYLIKTDFENMRIQIVVLPNEKANSSTQYQKLKYQSTNVL